MKFLLVGHVYSAHYFQRNEVDTIECSFLELPQKVTELVGSYYEKGSRSGLRYALQFIMPIPEEGKEHMSPDISEL